MVTPATGAGTGAMPAVLRGLKGGTSQSRDWSRSGFKGLSFRAIDLRLFIYMFIFVSVQVDHQEEV